jgi:methionine-rich copper-binding protein CopC
MSKKILGTFTMVGLFAAGLCFAHATLKSSTPAKDASLAAAPKTLTLNFSEEAQLASLKLVSGGKQTVVPLDKGAKAAKTFTLDLPALSSGAYVVQWTAIAADDGHVTKGSFSFSISG